MLQQAVIARLTKSSASKDVCRLSEQSAATDSRAPPIPSYFGIGHEAHHCHQTHTFRQCRQSPGALSLDMTANEAAATPFSNSYPIYVES